MIALQKKRTPIKQPRWYTDCAELPLINFIKIVCDANRLREWLTITGTPKESDLLQAWEKISESYNDLMGDTTQVYLLDLLSQISYLDEKLRIVYNIVAYLSVNRSEGLIKVLQEDLNFNYEYSDESIERDLKATVSEIKIDKVNLELNQNELKEHKDKGKPPTESDYDSILSTLSKHQGYHIRKQDITVSEFIAILNNFKDAHSNKPINSEAEAD